MSIMLLIAAIVIEVENQNYMTIVVGGSETVLTFDFAHHNGPYFASKGISDQDEPLMTCYLNFNHHTEFPRKYVIPLADGVEAVKEFARSGELPACVQWQE